MDSTWTGPSLYLDQELTGSDRELVIYGQDLIANTSYYLGPKGKVASLTNGMNCQNCHLDAGTKIYGNNYGSVNSHYPKFRPRSG
ncbi:MAG: cytochrome C, partial [Chitinophagaceae bacterium]